MHELRFKFYGPVDKHVYVIQAISQALKNVLVMTTIVDCQNVEQLQKKQTDGNFGDDQKISKLGFLLNLGN